MTKYFGLKLLSSHLEENNKIIDDNKSATKELMAWSKETDRDYTANENISIEVKKY